MDGKKDDTMRAFIMAVVVMAGSVAMAGEIEDAHRQAVAGRDSYWNCLSREYTRGGNRNLSGHDFTSLIASVCSSERQNFRVALVDYLSMQFRSADAGDPLTTANNAIALAQKEIVTAFIEHKPASK